MIPKQFLFLDLDETLIHAEYNNFSKKRIRVDFDFSNHSVAWGNGSNTESYGVVPRPNVHEFLKTVRLIYPNVYMLTAAKTEYGAKMNNACNLGFHINHIIGRDMTLTPDRHKFTIEPCVSVLVDNQFSSLPNARDKMEYLGTFGKASYIKCSGFHGHDNGEFTDKKINELVEKIGQAFNILSS
jgi:hypothetical protein